VAGSARGLAGHLSSSAGRLALARPPPRWAPTAGRAPGPAPVAGLKQPLLKFYFHEEVRQAAVQAMPELLRSAFLAAEKGAPGADMGLVKRMLDFIWPPIMEAMAKARRPPAASLHRSTGPVGAACPNSPCAA